MREKYINVKANLLFMPRLFKFESYGVAQGLTDIKPHIFMNCKNVSSWVVYMGLWDCEDTSGLYIWLIGWLLYLKWN